jgi:L-lysine 2,3-aminomutase
VPDIMGSWKAAEYRLLADRYESRVLMGLIHCAAPCCQRRTAMVRQDEQQTGSSHE